MRTIAASAPVAAVGADTTHASPIALILVFLLGSASLLIVALKGVRVETLHSLQAAVSGHLHERAGRDPAAHDKPARARFGTIRLWQIPRMVGSEELFVRAREILGHREAVGRNSNSFDPWEIAYASVALILICGIGLLATFLLA